MSTKKKLIEESNEGTLPATSTLEPPDSLEFDEEVSKQGLEHILSIAQARKCLLGKLKEAVLACDKDKVFEVAHELFGVSYESN